MLSSIHEVFYIFFNKFKSWTTHMLLFPLKFVEAMDTYSNETKKYITLGLLKNFILK